MAAATGQRIRVCRDSSPTGQRVRVCRDSSPTGQRTRVCRIWDNQSDNASVCIAQKNLKPPNNTLDWRAHDRPRAKQK